MNEWMNEWTDEWIYGVVKNMFPHEWMNNIHYFLWMNRALLQMNEWMIEQGIIFLLFQNLFSKFSQQTNISNKIAVHMYEGKLLHKRYLE